MLPVKPAIFAGFFIGVTVNFDVGLNACTSLGRYEQAEGYFWVERSQHRLFGGQLIKNREFGYS